MLLQVCLDKRTTGFLQEWKRTPQILKQPRSADETEKTTLADKLQTKIKLLDDHVKDKMALPGTNAVVPAKDWEDRKVVLKLLEDVIVSWFSLSLLRHAADNTQDILDSVRLRAAHMGVPVRPALPPDENHEEERADAECEGEQAEAAERNGERCRRYSETETLFLRVVQGRQGVLQLHKAH